MSIDAATLSDGQQTGFPEPATNGSMADALDRLGALREYRGLAIAQIRRANQQVDDDPRTGNSLRALDDLMSELLRLRHFRNQVLDRVRPLAPSMDERGDGLAALPDLTHLLAQLRVLRERDAAQAKDAVDLGAFWTLPLLSSEARLRIEKARKAYDAAWAAYQNATEDEMDERLQVRGGSGGSRIMSKDSFDNFQGVCVAYEELQRAYAALGKEVFDRER